MALHLGPLRLKVPSCHQNNVLQRCKICDYGTCLNFQGCIFKFLSLLLSASFGIDAFAFQMSLSCVCCQDFQCQDEINYNI